MACRAAVGRRQEGRSRAPGGGGRDPPGGARAAHAVCVAAARWAAGAESS